MAGPLAQRRQPLAPLAAGPYVTPFVTPGAVEAAQAYFRGIGEDIIASDPRGKTPEQQLESAMNAGLGFGIGSIANVARLVANGAKAGKGGELIVRHGTLKGNREGLTGPNQQLNVDLNKVHPNDQFLGPGFYTSLDTQVAKEAGNIRGTQVRGRVPEGHPEFDRFNQKYITTEGEIVTTQGIQKGETISGQPTMASKNTEVLDLDIAGLDKTYLIKDNADRVFVKKNIDKLKAEGYDSFAFEGFTDGQRQIMIIPEAAHKVKILKETPPKAPLAEPAVGSGARLGRRGKTREEIEIQGGPLATKLDESQVGRVLDEHGIDWNFADDGGITAVEVFTDKIGRVHSGKKHFRPNTSLRTIRNWLGY